jgi:hypothetical protein
MAARRIKADPSAVFSGEVDQVAFARAMERVTMGERLSEGFSVYQESYVHKAIKLYLEPNEAHHEVPLLGSVADIFDGDTVTEVQTGSFAPLLPKLEKLVRSYPVRLVHPFPVYTNKKWQNRETGEIILPKRSSPMKSIFSAARNIYTVRKLIPSDNLTVTLIGYECDEYRLLDGYGKDKKHRATLLGKIPTRLIGSISFATREDYLAFLPDGLPSRFTASDFLKLIGSRSRYDVMALKLLLHLGYIGEIGKQGRARLYELTNDENK